MNTKTKKSSYICVLCRVQSTYCIKGALPVVRDVGLTLRRLFENPFMTLIRSHLPHQSVQSRTETNRYHWTLRSETSLRKSKEKKKRKKKEEPPTNYLPFSIVVELNGHLAEGLPDRILTVHLLQTLCSCPWTAKPIFPHQHPTTPKQKRKNTHLFVIFTKTIIKY